MIGQMLKKEWSKVFSNKLLWLFLVGVALVPTLYTVVFLISMWDPYGNLDDLPVAIVNLDQQQTYKDRTVKVGEELVDELVEDNSLDFHVVDADEAQKGMEDGNYYMVITIPEDFSENALSVLDEKPKKMELSYMTNPGGNYISSKMRESAMRTSNTSIADAVTKEYSNTVFDLVTEIGDGLQEAADGSQEALDGTKKLADGNDTITTNLDTLASSSLTFKDGMDELSLGIGSYLEGADEIAKGSKKLSKGADQLNAGAKTLAKGVTKLDTGAGTLANGVATYTDGVDTAYLTGSQVLVANNAALNAGVTKVSSGVTSLKNGSAAVLAGLTTVSNTIGASMTPENQKQIATLTSGLSQIQAGMTQLNSEVQAMDLSGLDTMTKALTSVGGNVQTAGTSIQSAGTGVATAGAKVQSAGASLTAASGNVTSVATGVTTIAGNLQKVLQDPSLTEAEKQLIMASINEITKDGGIQQQLQFYQTNATAAGTALTEAGGSLNTVGGDLTSAGGELTKAGDTLTALKNSDATAGLSKVGELKTGVKTLSDNCDVALPAAVSTINTLSGGLVHVKTALDQTTAKDGQAGLIEGMTQIDGGLKTLDTGINEKGTGLKDGIGTYTAGVQTLNAGLKTLNSNSKALVDGSKELAAGTKTLNESVPTLTKGTTDLSKGAKTLKTGTNTLVSNNKTITSGLAQLTAGAMKISDGSGKLADGSKELGDGLETLQDGVGTLQSSLQDGADEVKDHTMSDDTADMIATPVETKESFFTTIDNNGSAMSAYMMCVGLWVAGLAFCVAFPMEDRRQKVKSATTWWLSKAIIFWTLAIVQAMIMVGVLMVVDGLSPAKLPATTLVAIVSSLAFESFVYLLVVLFDKIGDFMALIILILQLACCAGTYPIETSETIFGILNPFMPFTYSVHAFRATISDGPMTYTHDLMVLGIMFLVVNLLTYAFYGYKTYLIRRHRRSRLSGLREICMGVE